MTPRTPPPGGLSSFNAESPKGSLKADASSAPSTLSTSREDAPSSTEQAQAVGDAEKKAKVEAAKQARLAELGLLPEESMPLRRRLMWAGAVVALAGVAAAGAVYYFDEPDAEPTPVSQNRAPMPGETYSEDIEPVLTPAPEVEDWVSFGDSEVPMIDIEAYGGSLDVPEPSLSGLYTELAEPGAESGAALIAAHVDTDEGEPAAFWPLHEVQEGEIVTVHRNGEDYEYEITGLDVHEQDDLPAEFFDAGGEHRLYLMTCAGEPVETDGPWRYKYNLVVEATPISS